MSKRSAQVLDERTVPNDDDDDVVVTTPRSPEHKIPTAPEKRNVAIDKRLQQQMQCAVADAMAIGSRSPILLELDGGGESYLLAYTPRSSEAGLWLLQTLERTRLNNEGRHVAICSALVQPRESDVQYAFRNLRNNELTQNLDALGDFCWCSAGGEEVGFRLAYDDDATATRNTIDLYDAAHALYRQRGFFW